MEKRNEIELDGEFFEDVSKSYIQNLKFEKSFNLLQRVYSAAFELLAIAAQPIDKRSWREKQEDEKNIIPLPKRAGVIPNDLITLPDLRIDRAISEKGGVALNPITIDLDSIDGKGMIQKAIDNKDINIIIED